MMICLNSLKRKAISLLSAAVLLSGNTVALAEGEATPEPEDPGNYGCRVIDSYDYTTPVGWSDAIEESYYDDSLFAGDSRMGSLFLYGTHENAEVRYVTSLNLLMIDNMTLDEEELTEEQIENEEEITLMDVLRETTKANVYLLFGINEIRNPNFDLFGEKLDEIVAMLRENNPAVDVYIILAYHPDEITNLPEPDLSEHLLMLNTKLIEVAQKNHVYYLNLDDGLNDAEGTVIDEYTWDGLHFNVEGTHAFEDYLATHVARREVYVKETCE